MTTRRDLMTGALALTLPTAAAAQSAPPLRVGSTPTGIPFTFLDTRTNTIQGIMVDLMAALAPQAGFTPAIEPMQFSALIASLTAGRIDVIAAAMFATPARAQVIDFTDTIITYGEGLAVSAADKTEYTAMADLKGKVVGAQVGTAFVDALQKSGLFAEVKVYDTLPDILRDVSAGRIVAGFADYPIIAYNLKQGSFPGIRLVPGYKPAITGSVALGLRRNDPLTSKLNAALAGLKADGSITRILAKWGLE